VVEWATAFHNLQHHHVYHSHPVTTADSNARTAPDGTVRTTGAATTTTEDRKANGYWYPDHAVLNATKDQLKAMPQFKN
jgi:hypothetical protein